MFCTSPYQCKEQDYINSNPFKGVCLSLERREIMGNLPLTKYDKFLMACKDPVLNTWTQWSNIIYNFDMAIDLHRSVLACEILVESDYPTYEENLIYMRKIGKILELQGWKPHYFFSGNKSIHTSLFLNLYKCFENVEKKLLQNVCSYFHTEGMFVKKFMEFLRSEVLKGGVREFDFFDTQLIKCTHLIRMQLSKNKLGFKTFLGYSAADLPSIPVIANWDNGVFPVACKDFRLSVPNNFEVILSRFLRKIRSEKKKKKEMVKSFSLLDFGNASRSCVNIILKESFDDGRKRLAFVLVNELRKSKNKEEVRIIVSDWMLKNGARFLDSWFEIIWNGDSYRLNCGYLKKLYEELGLNYCEGCNRNVF